MASRALRLARRHTPSRVSDALTSRVHHMTSDQMLLDKVAEKPAERLSARGWRWRDLLREGIVYLMMILTAPLWLAAKIEAKLWGGDDLFASCSQFLSLFPGKLGIFLRRAYYRCTLEQCASDCAIGFGT